MYYKYHCKANSNEINTRTYIPRDAKEVEKLKRALRNYRSVKACNTILPRKKVVVFGPEKCLRYFETWVVND